ncbi:MAG: hypothetical protein IJA15_00440 [Clostridia bacterium]|nr:hypothetical protein [Clostridia bacterium]
MKVRKITAFIVAILSVLSIATYIPQANTVSAAANVEFVYSFNSYSVSYVTGKFTTETATGYKYKATDASEWSELITAAHVFKGDVSKTYEIKVFNGETEVATGTFGLIEKTDASSLKYTFATKTAAKYQEEIDALITKDTIKLGSTFAYPELKGILVSDHFDYDALKSYSKLTLYYAKPSATTFTSTTSKSFTLTEVGHYSYYVLAKDPMGTVMECDTEKLVRKVANGIEGWYDTKDTDDVSDDVLIVPIFSFDFAVAKKPEIDPGNIEDITAGFIGLEYLNAKDLINIVGDNEGARYELWYSANDLSAGVDNWKSEGFGILSAENSGAVQLKDEELEAVGFDQNTLRFTPNKVGSYYIVITAADGFGSDTAVTYAINVADKFDTVKINDQWWHYNWVSVMFLGISLLCLIAIILLIFVKPKEKVEEEVTTVEKK